MLGLALRLWKPEPLRPERRRSVVARRARPGRGDRGVLALQVVGPFACGLVVVALGLAAMRERRVRVVGITLAATALTLAVVFQVWR